MACSVTGLMDGYLAAKLEPFKGHPLHETIRGISAHFQRLLLGPARPAVRVRGSIGMGNWAAVPWLAFLDQRETKTTQKGVYVIILFRADMSGLYVTLNQGISKPSETMGRVAAMVALKERTKMIRERYPELRHSGFDVETAPDVTVSKEFAAGLKASTIAHRLFLREQVAEIIDVVQAASVILDVYDKYVQEPVQLVIQNSSEK